MTKRMKLPPIHPGFYDVVATEVHILAIVSKEQAEDWLRRVGSEK